jgi:DNA-binding SARP family transcriptional activator
LHGIHCPSAPRLGELCRLALQEQIETEHVRGLIRRRRLTAEPPPVEVDDWPWPLRIRALGTLQVWRDEEEIPLGKARVLSLLLKTLVALGQNERGVPASQLIAALWPDADGDVATKSFEVALLRVRRRLGSEGARAVRLEGGRVSLDRSVCWTDVDALRDWLGKPEPPGVAELRHRLDRLAALYRGPLLDGDDEVPLLVALDERLRANVASAVLAACRGLERHGDFAAATSAYVRALEADPRMGDLLAGPAVRGLVERGRVHEARALIALCRQAGGAVGDDGAPLL